MNSKRYQNLQAAILLYRKYVKLNPDTSLAACSAAKSIEEAIHFAVLSEDKAGKKHSHQYRLVRKAMITFEEKALLIKEKLVKADDFHVLYKLLKNLEVKSKGIGEMLTYDAAERIGQYLKLTPQKVYLHAGTRVGAEKLLGKINAEYIKKEQLPEPLGNSTLSCSEIEDILCMYHDMF